MHTNTSKSAAVLVIEEAEAQIKSMKTLRAELRRTSQPGDPEREARLAEGIVGQMLVMTKVRGLLAKLQWETVKLTVGQTRRLRDASRALSSERRQLKKMQRT